MKSNKIETVAIRRWKGQWACDYNGPEFIHAPGGYVLTFHQGENLYKVEHYDTIDDIIKKYYNIYIWLYPDIRDEKDIILVGL